MNLHSLLRKFSISSLFFGAALSLGSSANLSAVGQNQQQQSSQTQQQPSQQQQSDQQRSNSRPAQQPEAKQKKVWTNDDVVSLRTPSDVYLAEKEAQEAAAAEAAAKEAAKIRLGDVARATEKLPPTAEETRKLIAAKDIQIADDQQALDRYTVELPNEPADRKDRMQKEIKRITAGLPKERSELKMLQDHLEKLYKTQLNEAPTSPPVPPSH
ncbi:MAG: hypothetical protein ACHP8A_16945 [Terriglobales bacterium]